LGGKPTDHGAFWDPDWHWITKLLTAWILLLFCWGFAFYPLAPYKQCDGGHYCDKRHHYHSSDEYDAFKLWEAILFASGLCGTASRLVEWGRRRTGKPPCAMPPPARTTERRTEGGAACISSFWPLHKNGFYTASSPHDAKPA
jgi:hypothetical protein